MCALRILDSHVMCLFPVHFFWKIKNPLAATQEVDWSRAGLEPILSLLQDAVTQNRFQPDPDIPLQIQPSKDCFEKVKAKFILKYGVANM